MVYMPSIPLFSPFMCLKNSLDAERYHTSLVLRSTMRCMYAVMLPMMGFRMALIYSLVAVYNKGYTLLWLGISIGLNSPLTIISFTASDLNFVGYMCVIICRLQSSICIEGLISSCTSSNLVAYTTLQDSTLGGGSLTF